MSKIKDIWYGKDINAVRKAHVDNKANSIDICKSCPFKETYKWEKNKLKKTEVIAEIANAHQGSAETAFKLALASIILVQMQ